MTRFKLGLLLLSLAFAPIVFAPQWIGMLRIGSFTYMTRANYETPFWLIAIREGLPIAFVLVVAVSQRSFWRDRAMLPVFALVSLFGIATVTLWMSDLGTVLIRAALAAFARYTMFFVLPVAVYSFLIRTPTRRYLRIAWSAVVALLLFSVMVSFAQTLWGLADEMNTFLGPRAVGISTNPNTAGALTGIGALLLLYRWRPSWLWPVLYGLFTLGAIVTGSRTGIVGTIVVGSGAVWASRQPGRLALIPLLGVLLPLVLANLSFLSGRSAVIDARDGILGDPHFQMLASSVGRMSGAELVAGHGLGFATNVGFRMANTAFGGGFVPATDSLLTTAILQFGVVGALIFVVATAGFFLSFVPFRAAMVLLVFFGIFGGVTQNIMETYPVGMLLGVLLGCWAAERHLSEERG
jgi:hypothetical protein